MEKIMALSYREKLHQEIESVPDGLLPQFYRIVHVLKLELLPKQKHGKRGSLKGIWKGGEIDDSLLEEAKKSLYSYELDKDTL